MKKTHEFTTPTGLLNDERPFTVQITEEDGIPTHVKIAFGAAHSVIFSTEAFFTMVDQVRNVMAEIGGQQ